jgi:hypothetical protein
VRGSSHKEKINISDKLVVYLMHGTTLWCYIQDNEKLISVDNNAYNLYYMSDSIVFYSKTEHNPDSGVDHSTIVMCETLPASYK